MSESIKLNCPQCNTDLKVNSVHAGKRLKCPKWQAIVVVPMLSSIVEPPLKSDENFFQEYENAPAGKQNSPKTFVVRFAPDVISKPMTGDELLKALAEGKLQSQMLFAPQGTAAVTGPPPKKL